MAGRLLHSTETIELLACSPLTSSCRISFKGLGELGNRLAIWAVVVFFRRTGVVFTARTVCGLLVFGLLLAARPVAGQLNEVTVSIVRFVNLSGSEDDRWIGIGIADSVAADLLVSGTVRVLMTEQEGTAVVEDSDWLNLSALVTKDYSRQ